MTSQIVRRKKACPLPGVTCFLDDLGEPRDILGGIGNAFGDLSRSLPLKGRCQDRFAGIVSENNGAAHAVSKDVGRADRQDLDRRPEQLTLFFRRSQLLRRQRCGPPLGGGPLPGLF